MFTEQGKKKGRTKPSPNLGLQKQQQLHLYLWWKIKSDWRNLFFNFAPEKKKSCSKQHSRQIFEHVKGASLCKSEGPQKQHPIEDDDQGAVQGSTQINLKKVLSQVHLCQEHMSRTSSVRLDSSRILFAKMTRKTFSSFSWVWSWQSLHAPRVVKSEGCNSGRDAVNWAVQRDQAKKFNLPTQDRVHHAILQDKRELDSGLLRCRSLIVVYKSCCAIHICHGCFLLTLTWSSSKEFNRCLLARKLRPALQLWLFVLTSSVISPNSGKSFRQGRYNTLCLLKRQLARTARFFCASLIAKQSSAIGSFKSQA